MRKRPHCAAPRPDVRTSASNSIPTANSRRARTNSITLLARDVALHHLAQTSRWWAVTPTTVTGARSAIPRLNRSSILPRGEQWIFSARSLPQFGSVLLVAELMASWVFRSATAPLIAKIAIPAIIVALACETPYQVDGMLGFPFSTPLASLPARFEVHRVCRA